MSPQPWSLNEQPPPAPASIARTSCCRASSSLCSAWTAELTGSVEWRLVPGAGQVCWAPPGGGGQPGPSRKRSHPSEWVPEEG